MSTVLYVGGQRYASFVVHRGYHSRPLPDVGVTRRDCCKSRRGLQVGLGRMEEPFEGEGNDGRKSGRRDYSGGIFD